MGGGGGGGGGGARVIINVPYGLLWRASALASALTCLPSLPRVLVETVYPNRK